MNKHTYRIITNDREFLVEADNFEIDKDKGTIAFFDILAVTITRLKWVFVLNNIIGFSIIDEEKHENYNS